MEWDTLTLGTQANPFPPAAVFSRLYGPLCGISEIRTPPFPETGTAEFFYARVSGSSRAVLAEKDILFGLQYFRVVARYPRPCESLGGGTCKSMARNAEYDTVNELSGQQ